MLDFSHRACTFQGAVEHALPPSPLLRRRPPAVPPPAVLKTGVISQAAGSAYAEFGRTKIMVGVYGPRQSDRRAPYSESGRVDVDLKLASFATRHRGDFHQASRVPLPSPQLPALSHHRGLSPVDQANSASFYVPRCLRFAYFSIYIYISVQSAEERELSSVVQTALRGVVATETFPKAVLDVYCTVLEAGGSEAAVAICAAALAVADAGVETRDVVTACAVVS